MKHKLLKIALLVVILLSGCGKGGGQKSHSQDTSPASVQFDGMDEGCKLAYDELFCPPSFKDGNLKAGVSDKWKYYTLPNDDKVYRVELNTTLPKGAKILVRMVDVNESLGGE